MHVSLEFLFLPGELNGFHCLVAFFILIMLFFPLESILSHINIATSDFFWLLFAWRIFFFRFVYSQPFNALYINVCLINYT